MQWGAGPEVAAAGEEGSVSQGEGAGAGIGKVLGDRPAGEQVKVVTSEQAAVVSWRRAHGKVLIVKKSFGRMVVWDLFLFFFSAACKNFFYFSNQDRASLCSSFDLELRMLLLELLHCYWDYQYVVPCLAFIVLSVVISVFLNRLT